MTPVLPQTFQGLSMKTISGKEIFLVTVILIYLLNARP